MKEIKIVHTVKSIIFWDMILFITTVVQASNPTRSYRV
jgi:hypothetical protein